MKYILFLIFCFISYNTYSQEDSLKIYFDKSITIDSIKIIGNNITEEDIILRELTFQRGDSISLYDIKYNEERIFSLGIFTRVELRKRELNDITILYIYVQESWYIYPIPFVGLRDNDWKKVTYGVNLLVKNFRGRNETINFAFALGFDPSVELSYNRPYLFSSSDYYFYSNLYYKRIRNKSLEAIKLIGRDFDQKFTSFLLGVGRRFDVFNKASIHAGFVYVESPFSISNFSASNERFDRKPFIGLSYTHDTRDLAQFPKNGLLINSSMDFKGLSINNINYQVFNFDIRHYEPFLSDFIFKWNFKFRTAFGKKIPFYDYSYLGYGNRVRGHFRDKEEGHNLYLGSIEVYYPLVKDFTLDLTSIIPLVPVQLLQYRIGVYSQIFADAGTTQYRNTKLAFRDFASGYGVGLSFLLLPYNAFRIEAAIDEHKNLEWIFELGISF